MTRLLAIEPALPGHYLLMKPSDACFAFAVCALGLAGCGGESSPATARGGSDAGGSAAAGASGALATGGVVGTGASGAPGAGASSAGGAVSCSSFADAAGWSLRVRIRNEMSSTLYVGQENSTCDVDLLFQVEDGARQKLPRLNGCPSSCQTAMASGAVLCPDSCALPSTVTLEPGQSIELPWDGRFAVEHLLPPQCLRPELQSPANCVRAEQVEAGPYHFLARAGTGRHCLSGTCGACTPNPNGGCTTPGSLITGTIITTERFVGLEPGELSPSGTPPLLLLVFEKLG